MTMRVKFDEVVVRVRRSGSCSRCGRRARRTYKLWQTVSPFNRNAEGLPKTKSEIEAELRNDAKKVEERVLMCARCEHQLVGEWCEAAPDLHDAAGDDVPRATEALNRLVARGGG
jgi:hypothetical protein